MRPAKTRNVEKKEHVDKNDQLTYRSHNSNEIPRMTPDLLMKTGVTA